MNRKESPSTQAQSGNISHCVERPLLLADLQNLWLLFKVLRGRIRDLKITCIFILEFPLGGALQSLHLWLHTSLFLIWISLSIIMPHFMQYLSIHSDLNSDHYLNVLLSELCRTPWLGGQAAWRDVSHQHFPSWDLKSITVKLLDMWVLKSPGLSWRNPSCKAGCSEGQLQLLLGADSWFSLQLRPQFWAAVG